MNLHEQIALGVRLHEITKDPMLASAVALLAQELGKQELDEAGQRAYTLIDRMAGAYLTLYGTSDISPPHDTSISSAG